MSLRNQKIEDLWTRKEIIMRKRKNLVETLLNAWKSLLSQIQ